MSKNLYPWTLRGSDFSRPGWHLEPTAGYELMLEFLRVSPSYELARKANMEGLSEQEKLELPTDFDRVLETYKKFGDIRQLLFRQWWLKRGLRIFGNPYSKPEVSKVASIESGEDFSMNAFSAEILEHVNENRRDQGLPGGLLVFIPSELKKRDITRQLGKILDTNPVKAGSRTSGPKLKLVAKRLRAKVLLNGIFLLWIKSARPGWPNWKLGAAVKFSPTYSPQLKVTDPKKGVRPDEQYDRIAMAKITVRALRKFEKIAENAARGKFPSQDDVEIARFDYPQIAKRIQAWGKWKKREKSRLLAGLN